MRKKEKSIVAIFVDDINIIIMNNSLMKAVYSTHVHVFL